MAIIHRSKAFIALCFSIASIFVVGCAVKAPPVVDAGTVGDVVLDVRESIALARSEGAAEHAPQELARAEALLNEAQEAIKKGKTQDAADISFEANIEAKIATAMSREVKAKRRAAEALDGKLEALWDIKSSEVATAQARQAIAERKALQAQKAAEKAEANSNTEIRKAKVELVVAKAELQVDMAEQAKASLYAEDAFNKAKSSIQVAKSALDSGSFQKAETAAEEAKEYASTAYTEAKARQESEAQEAMRSRDKAVISITKAQLSMETAVEALASQYAKDMYQKSEKLIEDARAALKVKDYDLAVSLAEQARVSASSALAVAVSKEKETQIKEDLENARAEALDAVAKAERSIAEAKAAGAEELAGDIYRKAQSAFDQAKAAAQEEDFEKVLALTRESFSHSTTALAMAEGMTEQKRKIEETENNIIKEAEAIPDSSILKTNRGVVVSMGGELFAKSSSKIRPEEYARLKMLAELLKKYPDYKVVIEGHTDNIGSDESNLKISSERSHNFLRYLVDSEGIPLERLSSVGYGESRPIASNINEDGRRQNRRVDIVILTKLVSP